MATLDSLQELMEEELKDIYDAEKQLTKALPKMVKKATAQELKAAFQGHLRQTEQHVQRIERIFKELDMPARGKKCEGMKHLLAEGDEMIGEAEDNDTRDAVMIAAAQKVEHYEIASYGTVRTWATLLGKNNVAAVLEETLEEEKETDQQLTAIAESFVNEAAVNSEEEEEEDENTSTGRGRESRARIPARGMRQSAAERARSAARQTNRSRSK
jgi:ferritin-like metal-binding protein YciE